MHNDSPRRSKLHREELKQEAERKIHEMAFKGCGYGNSTFDTIPEAYRCDQPYGIPRPPKEENIVKVTSL